MDNNKKRIIIDLTSKLKGKPGFTTPKNYFNQIEDNFFTKLSENKLSKHTGFNVPANYFDKIEGTILEKTATSKKEVKVISLKDRIPKLIPIAAASILLFISINLFFKSNNSITLEDISTAEIENWYENGYGEINNNDLILSFDDDDFNEDELIITSINQTDIETYLDNIDPTILENKIH